MFGIGMTELLVILVVALLVFGPTKLPELARSLGRAMHEFRRASNDLRASFNEAIEPAPPARSAPPQPLAPGARAPLDQPAPPAAAPDAAAEGPRAGDPAPAPTQQAAHAPAPRPADG
jgi:TatA/E family protein of Tat protein translocase